MAGGNLNSSPRRLGLGANAGLYIDGNTHRMLATKDAKLTRTSWDGMLGKDCFRQFLFGEVDVYFCSDFINLDLFPANVLYPLGFEGFSNTWHPVTL